MKHSIAKTGFLTAGIVYLVTTIFDLDLYERAATILAKLDKYEIDELIIPLTIIVIALLFDFRHNVNEARTENEKMRIYKAMVFSTHHILNNFLNQMQLFKMTAENSQGFPDKILNLFDSTMAEASTQIEALSSVNDIDEEHIYEAVKPK